MKSSSVLSLRAALAACALLFACAASAFAQDYTTTLTSGKYTAPPSSGVTNVVSGDDSRTNLNLPFSFPYYGNTYSTINVCTNGFAQFGGTGSTFSNSTLPQSTTQDGILAVLWDDMYVTGPSSNASITNDVVRTWTSGTAPNRVQFISWVGIKHYSNRNATLSYQIQLHETSGRIIFAYDTSLPVTTSSSGTGWYCSSFTCGIDEYGGTRYVYHPNHTGSSNSGRPSDCIFDPVETRFSGRLLIDEIVSDATGIGNSVRAGQPLPGATVELRSGAKVVGVGESDANGDYVVKGLALNSSQSGTLHAVAKNLACVVSPSSPSSTAAPASFQVSAGTVSFGGNTTIPTYTLGSSTDATGNVRAAFQIAGTMRRAYDFLTTNTAATLPRLDVFFDPASSLNTSYSPPGALTAYAQIGSVGSSNNDAFDTAVVHRVYGRYALSQMTSAMSGANQNAFQRDLDVVSDPENALAEAFGLYLYAVVEGQSVAYDGLSSSATTSFDLDAQTLTTAKNASVAAWAAQALYDTVDPANEPFDDIDGTLGSANTRIAQAIDTLGTYPDGLSIVAAWDGLGFDTARLVRNFIFHGLLPDDQYEPNDSAGFAQHLGVAGVRKDGLSLNRFNEDWYTVDFANDVDLFYVDMLYDRSTLTTNVTMQVFDIQGNLLANGSPTGALGPVTAVYGPFPAGRVTVRLAHGGGDAITNYTLQVYERLAIGNASVTEWTLRRPMSATLSLRGGIPPYTLSVRPPSVLPKGLALDAVNGRVFGAPAETGFYTYSIAATDSGLPQTTTNATQSLQVNDELTFGAPILTGLALGKQSDISLGRRGGTDPVVVTNVVGTLPDGLTLTDDFHIVGAADQAFGTKLSIDAEDIAGSAAHIDTTVVVCKPFEGARTPLDLAAGEATGGFYFDSLGGSTVSFVLGTPRGEEKRSLQFVLLGPDGLEVPVDGASVKDGKIVVRGVRTAKTGRYFIALSSPAGSASQLEGALRVGLPAGGAGAVEQLDFNEQTRIEFGALEGAVFTLKGKMTEGMAMRVLYMIQPDGKPVLATDFDTREKNGKITLSITLKQSGTYQFFTVPKPGPLGDFRFKYKLRQPKRGQFQIND